ncbi:MAG: hypothetical protein ACTSPG_06775 [Candidatus Hodarchaeales archaeon]
MSETRVPFLEPAKSGRAKCRGCQEKINKGEIRVGLPYSFAMKDGREIESYHYYHVNCVPSSKVSSVLEILQETEFIDSEKLEVIRNALESARSQRRQKLSIKTFIEKSPSSRATCKICEDKILKEEFRVIEPFSVELEDGRVFPSKKYYHFECYINTKDDMDQAVNDLVKESIKHKFIDDEEVKIVLKKLDEMRMNMAEADDFLALLNGNPKSLKELTEIAKKIGLNKAQLRKILEEKIKSGEIFQPKLDYYQKL